MTAIARQKEGEVNPKDQDGTGHLKGQSRGVCGCFHLTALIWVGSESANAADCKSVPYRVVGSTPTLPTIPTWYMRVGSVTQTMKMMFLLVRRDACYK